MEGEYSGVGIVATTPGDTESHSGHIATRMMVAIFLHFHDEVHIFTRATAVMDFDEPNVQVHRYTKPLAKSSTGFRLFGHLLYQMKYFADIYRYREDLDVVFISSSGTIFILLAARLARVFAIYRVGGALYQQFSPMTLKQRIWTLFLKSVEKMAYATANAIVVMSPSQADSLELGHAREKTHVWNHYYFDLDQFNIDREYDQRDVIIGHVGVSEVKGSSKFLQAINQLDSDLINKVLIIGDGPTFEQVRSKASHSKHDVEFTGKIDRSEIPEQFNRMKLFVLCSESEGVPKVAIESMACGTPVLATKVGGTADYIIHGENGFLIPDNDPETIATAVEEVLMNENLSSFSDLSRRSIENEFSFDKVKQRYRELITMHSPVDI